MVVYEYPLECKHKFVSKKVYTSLLSFHLSRASSTFLWLMTSDDCNDICPLMADMRFFHTVKNLFHAKQQNADIWGLTHDREHQYNLFSRYDAFLTMLAHNDIFHPFWQTTGRKEHTFFFVQSYRMSYVVNTLVGNVLCQDRVLSEDRTGHCRHAGTCLPNILQTCPPDRVLSEDRTGHLQTYFY